MWRSFTQLLGTRHLRTTAYHPCANGLVERLHRQLKAALKSYPQQGNWTDALPLVLLGIRTSIKEDLGCTAAQLVYGTTLHLPGSFFSAPTDSNPDPQSYVLNLQYRMQQLQATPPRPVNNTPISSNEALWNSPYVFIRHDRVRKPLQPPYDGPFKVLDRAPKYFTINVKGRRDTVTIDRLKPAHLDTAPSHTQPPVANPNSEKTLPVQRRDPPSSSVMAPPTRSTRSGRHVHWPSHLADIIR